jgi:hypothetical protein
MPMNMKATSAMPRRQFIVEIPETGMGFIVPEVV